MRCAIERKNADEACRCMQLLLQRGADTETRSLGPHRGFAALNWAAIQGRPEPVELPIKAGAKVNNAMETDGWTLLAEPCYWGSRNVARALLTNGTYLDTRETDDNTLITLACLTPLLLATANRHLETIKLLLEHGVDVDAQDEVGGTASVAARHGRRAPW